MDFGLGLVLTLTDNATSGLQNAVNSLNQLTETASNASSSLTGMAQLGAFSVVADQMGTKLIGAGNGVLSMFTNLLGKVQQVGSDFEGFRITLNALYGDEQKAEEQIGKLLDFSIKSPFEVNDVKDMLVVLKSQGIDAFQMMSNEAENFQQENLAWISDLMAFKPDVPAQRWKLALTNYLGSGEAKMLRNLLDMGQIDQILGHEIGETAEERMNDIREIVEKNNLQGLAEQLSVSWTGVASNVSDAYTKIYKAVADNGVFDKLKQSFMSVSGVFLSMDNDQLEALGKTLADGLNLIVEPITIVADKVNTLIGKIVELCQTHPEVVKWGMVIVAVAGGLLVFAGVALKVMSAMGMMTIGLTQFGNAFSSIGALIKSGSLKIIGSLIPMSLTIGLIYLAWKTDFGGIKTMLTDFVTNVRTSFSEARNASSMGVNGMMGVVTQLESKNNFWSNFTVGLIKVKTAWDILKDAWSDYTISDELYEKMNALGLRPLVEAILDFKWRFDHFIQGFMEGWNRVSNFVRGVFDNIRTAFKGTFLGDMLDGLTKFFQLLTNNDPESWRKVGVVVGELAAVLLPLSRVMKIFNKVTTGGGILSRIFGGSKAGGAGGIAGGSGGGILSNPMQALKTVGSLAILIGGFVGLVEALGALSKVPGFNDFLDNGAKTLAKLSESLIGASIIAGALGLLSKGLSVAQVTPTVALKGIADMAILIGGLDVLILALGALQSIPGFSDFLSTGVNVINSLFDVLRSMFDIKVIGTIALMSALGVVPIPVAAAGVANLAILLGGLSALIEAFGLLSEIPGFNEFLEKGGDTLSLLFEQLGKCVGAVIGGIGEGITASLPDIGTNIANFGTNVKPFFDMTSGVDFDGVSKFAGAFAALIGALTVEKLTSFITGGVDLPAVGTQLSGFAENGATFFSTVADIPENGFSNAEKMFGALDGLNNYSFKSGGALQAITGELALDQVGTQLSSFATNGATFFESVANVPENAFTQADKMFASLEGLNNYSFKSGGLAQLFTGSLDIAGIGTQLSSFATNASTFFSTVSTIPEAGISGAVSIFEALGGLDAYEFKSGGLAQLFTGSFDIADVGEQLSDFAENAATFFSTAATVSDTGLSNGASMLGILATVGDNQGVIDAMGASWGSLSSVGQDLADFATNSADFFTAAEAFSPDTSTKATSMLGIMNSLSSIPDGTKELKNVGKNLSAFASNAANFFTLVSGLDDATVSRGSQMATMITELTTTLQNVGNQNFDMSAITTQLTDFATTLTTFATQVGEMPDFSKLSEFTTSLSGFGSAVTTASTAVTSSFDNIVTSSGNLQTAISTDFTGMQTTVTTSWTTMNTTTTTAMSTMSSSVSTSFSTINSS